MRLALADTNAHGANRQGGQRLEGDFAAPVFRHVTTMCPLFGTEHSVHRFGKAADQRPAANLPVGALEDHEKVVAADVADKILRLVSRFADQAAERLNHVITAPVAEGVVVGLEIVDIDVSRDKATASRQHAVDMFVDRHIARQLGQRIGVAGGADLHFGNRRHQVVAAADPEILALAGDDEAIEQVMLRRQRNHQRQFLDGGVLIDHQRRVVHEQVAGLATEQFLAKRPGEAVNHAVPVDHADRMAALHDR